MKESYVRTYIADLAAFAVLLSASWCYWYGFDSDLSLIIGAFVFAVLIFIGEAFPINTEEGSTVETETESLPQLAQPMSLGSPTPFIVNSASWHKVDEVCLLLSPCKLGWCFLTPSGQE